MELKKLIVRNYKSLVNFELNEPNAFTVFAGPNGAGKSNIFEAVEFGSYSSRFGLQHSEVENIFGGWKQFINFNIDEKWYKISLTFEFVETSIFQSIATINSKGFDYSSPKELFAEAGSYTAISKIKKGERDIDRVEVLSKYFDNCLRLYIGNDKVSRIKYTSNERLLPDASNLESVLKRILKDEAIKEEFLEWLDLFIPGFSNIEIHSDNIGGTDTLLIYEEGTTKPFTKTLISDGTYNILALLTAVYQTAEPQFLCIEEPENGLNPYVVESLVDFFRRQCEEKGHVIWLNTHSQTLVNKLRPEELVLVDKVNGETKTKQFTKDYNLHGLALDTAWLSNALGGGLPW